MLSLVKSTIASGPVPNQWLSGYHNLLPVSIVQQIKNVLFISPWSIVGMYFSYLPTYHFQRCNDRAHEPHDGASWVHLLFMYSTYSSGWNSSFQPDCKNAEGLGQEHTISHQWTCTNCASHTTTLSQYWHCSWAQLAHVPNSGCNVSHPNFPECQMQRYLCYNRRREWRARRKSLRGFSTRIS